MGLVPVAVAVTPRVAVSWLVSVVVSSTLWLTSLAGVVLTVTVMLAVTVEVIVSVVVTSEGEQLDWSAATALVGEDSAGRDSTEVFWTGLFSVCKMSEMTLTAAHVYLTHVGRGCGSGDVCCWLSRS